MNGFCTIVTSDYYFYVQAICDSITRYNKDFKFFALVVDHRYELKNTRNLRIIYLEDLKSSYEEDYRHISKYENDPESNLRWALKPLFLKFLLNTYTLDKAIFVDPDLYFYKNPIFLLNLLGNGTDVIITPHWRSINPKIASEDFDKLFTEGLFNAGFFGCSKHSLDILDWWLGLCSYKMEKSNGFYVDQTYLNLLPVYYATRTHIVKHKGCNLSIWNLEECKRVNIKGEVKINGIDDVIFIHFTKHTINAINSGKDGLLQPHLKEYKDSLLNYNPNFKFSFEQQQNTDSKKIGLKNLLKKYLKN